MTTTARNKTAHGKRPNPLQGLRLQRIEVLRTVNVIAQAILDDFLDEEDGASFKGLLAFAHTHGVIDDNVLAAMGRVGQTTANRWIRGESVPMPATQETVLRKLVDASSAVLADVDKPGREQSLKHYLEVIAAKGP